ncbi:MAG: acylphosphatase [Phycisphaeraceae bacterium]|nr:acylphosphatase [Phycisphaeraceae bacterium]
MERRRIVFSGHVQGVGFRATTRHIAQSYALTGWVRNEPDGAVTVEAQGEAPEIELFLIDLRERMSGFIRDERADGLSVIEGETEFRVLP